MLYQTNNNFFFHFQKKILEYLFLFLPIFLVTGPFLSDLSLSIISIIFLIYVFKQKKYDLLKRKFFYIFILFYVYLNINSFIQNINFDSIKISLTYIRFGVFSLAVIYILNLSKKILFKLFLIFQITFYLLIIDGFFQYFSGQNILGYELSTGPRISSFFGDELILGSYLSRSFPVYLALYFYFYDKLSTFNKFSAFILFIFIEVMTFLSGERTAFFLLNLFVIFIIFFNQRFKNFKLIFFTILISLLTITSFTFPDSNQRILKNALNQMNLNTEKKFTFFSRQHQELYETALRITKDNFIIGVGVKNFRKFCSDTKYSRSSESCSTHPHNTYVQLLVELGLIGFFFGLFLFFYLLKILFIQLFNIYLKKKLYDDFQICLLGAILITLWPVAPSGNIFNNWLNVVYFYPFSILMWSIYGKKT